MSFSLTAILIVDEILAVGDAAFQQKCEQRMDKLLSGGTTRVFVSYSAEQVKRLCKRAVWIDHGQVQMIGDSAAVCDAYQKFWKITDSRTKYTEYIRASGLSQNVAKNIKRQ